MLDAGRYRWIYSEWRLVGMNNLRFDMRSEERSIVGKVRICVNMYDYRPSLYSTVALQASQLPEVLSMFSIGRELLPGVRLTGDRDRFRTGGYALNCTMYLLHCML